MIEYNWIYLILTKYFVVILGGLAYPAYTVFTELEEINEVEEIYNSQTRD